MNRGKGDGKGKGLVTPHGTLQGYMELLFMETELLFGNDSATRKLWGGGTDAAQGGRVGAGKTGFHAGSLVLKPAPVQEHTPVLICLRVLIVCVFLFGRPQCAVFPALFVCRNMAELNVDDPSFWFDDGLAARDEDEAIVDECYEAATDALNYAGSISEGDSDTNRVGLCDDQPEFCDDQQGPVNTEIGTMRPRARLHVLILD